MKLIAEQLHALRKRKSELVATLRRFNDYARNQRERDSIDGIGTPVYTDYLAAEEYGRAVNEYSEIQQILCSCELVEKRELDKIEIGTAFYAHFDGDAGKERFVLVEKGIPSDKDYHFLSLDSDFGRAVLGKRAGENVVYQTGSSATPIQVSIDEIDQISKNYLHFLRKAKPTKARHLVITESQRVLAGEELLHDHNLSPERKAVLRKAILSPTVKAPKDGTIGIGSKVSAFIIDDDGEGKDLEFEVIDKAIATELDCDYVERQSPLGRAVMGLQEKDTFIVSGTNTKGVILSVCNEEKEKERVF